MGMLSLFSSIYGKVTSFRNTLYEKGVFEIFDARVRVISVGNITAGGTGKTPLVALIAGVLSERGEKVCILTRGYGRVDAGKRVVVTDGKRILSNAEHSGDEPFELANKLLGKVIIIADADRVAAAKWAKRKFGVTVFILDDGFQHRQIKRDLDIVCIDATDVLKHAKMLPAGRLREPLSGIQRADAIVITRSNLVRDISDLKFEISELNAETPVFAASNRISAITPLTDANVVPDLPQDAIMGLKAFAFCGLGNPDNFSEQLRREGVHLSGSKAFRDHHKYSEKDVVEIENEARISGAKILMTTAKDAVKLSNFKFEMPCYIVEIETVIDDQDGFNELL